MRVIINRQCDISQGCVQYLPKSAINNRQRDISPDKLLA